MGGNFDSNIKNRNGSKKYTVQNHTGITSHARVDQDQSQNTKIFHREMRQIMNQQYTKNDAEKIFSVMEF